MIGDHVVTLTPDPYGAGETVDVTCLVDRVSIHHGRDDTDSQPEASAATLELSQVVEAVPLPGLEVGAVVLVETVLVDVRSVRFRGRVTDITYAWEDAGEFTPNRPTAQVIAVAALADLGRRVVGDAPWPQELDGARVANVMAAAGVVLDPAYSDPGTVQILPRDVDSQPALEVAQGTAESANGTVWQTRAGEVRYADAAHRRGVPISLELDACDVLVTPQWRRSTEALLNRVSLGYGPVPDEGEQARFLGDNPTSVARYGRYELSTETELATVDDATALGNLLLTRNATPVWIMSELPVDMKGLSAADTAALLALDMHSLVNLTGLPAVGTAPTTAMLWLEGWTESLAWGEHEITLCVSGYCRTVPAPRWNDVDPAWTWDGAIGPSVLVAKNLGTVRAPSANGSVVLTPGVQWNGATWTRLLANLQFHGARHLLDLADLVNGETYTASWLLGNDGATPLEVSLDWADVSAGQVITTIQPGEVRRVSVTGVRATYDATFRFHDLAIREAARSILFRQIIVQRGTAVGPYFDGNTPDTADDIYAWTGNANASTSTRSTVPTGSPVLVARNRIANPDCETSINGFNSNNSGIYPVTRDAAAPITGTGSAMTTHTGAVSNSVASLYVTGIAGGTVAASCPALTPGEAIRMAIDVKTERPSRYLSYYIAFRKPDGSANGQTAGLTTQVPVAGVTRVTADGVVPDGTSHGYMIAAVQTVGAVPCEVNERAWFDRFYVGPQTADYFDGDTPDTPDREYRWDGVPHQSTSSQWTIPDNDWATMTWDEAHCLGPPLQLGRWDDTPASDRWDLVPATTTWDTWK